MEWYDADRVSDKAAEWFAALAECHGVACHGMSGGGSDCRRWVGASSSRRGGDLEHAPWERVVDGVLRPD